MVMLEQKALSTLYLRYMYSFFTQVSTVRDSSTIVRLYFVREYELRADSEFVTNYTVKRTTVKKALQ